MPAPLVYNVLTEFRFEVGSAILGSERLAGAVEDVSNAADNALFSFKKLGMGVVYQMGLAEGSIFGVIGKAVQVSDKFKQIQLAFSNIISSNREHLIGPIDTFNERLGVSSMIMKNIGRAAREFGLDEMELVESVKLTSAQLVPKGLAGTNFGTAINLSRNLMKSAPTLGVAPQDVQGQLLRAIEGGASMGDTLFRRLAGETQAFKGMKGSQAFNALPAAKRVEILDKALKQFASDTQVLEANVMTLSGQFRVLKTLIAGPISSILKPLGDVILPPLVRVLREFNQVLDTDVRAMVEHIADFIGPIIENPRKLLINLLQLKELSNDVNKGAKTFGILGIASALMHLGKVFPAVGAGLAAVGGFARNAIIGIAALIPWGKVFGFVFTAFGAVITRVLPPMLAIMAVFQTISRAMAIAKIKDIEALPKMLPGLTKLLDRARNAFEMIFAPLMAVMNAAAEFISPLFQMTNWIMVAQAVLEPLVDILEALGTVSILAWAGLQGLFFGLFKIIENISSGKILGAFTGVSDAFNAGVNDIIENNMKNLRNPEGAIVNQVTNIGKVEIKNQFRENMEPDRIAFGLTKQLMKVAQNPTQSRGRQFAPVGGSG